jgi:hypothetical protein
MQTLVLSIGSPINISLQVGDAAYYSPVNTVANSGFSASNNSVIFLGTVININYTTFLIQVMYDDTSGVSLPSQDDYIMFGKNKAVNSSDVKGYYANVKFVNRSKEKIELFSVGSEVSQSSK